MKRPQGFDPKSPNSSNSDSAVTRPEAAEKRDEKPAGKAKEKSHEKRARRSVASPSGSESQLVSELLSAPEPRPVSKRSPASESQPPIEQVPPAPQVAPVEPPLDPVEALAAAERERRRYERDEVRRFTRRHRRRRGVWLLGVAAIVLLVAVTFSVAYSPLMALRQIQVQGTQRLAVADVTAALDDRMGAPLPLIDDDQIRSRLEKFSIIQSFSIRAVPPGTMVLQIVERQPVGVVQEGTEYRLVDAAGVTIETGTAAQAGYPIIVAPGVSDRGFAAAADVIRSLPDDVRARLATVTAATADDVRLRLNNGASVVWGSASDSALKAKVLAALLSAAPVGTVNEYDVSSPAVPVTR